MDDLTAQELEQILNSGSMEDSSQDALLQLAMLQKLRGNMSPLQGRQAGDIYTANHPLEHLARAMEMVKMNQKEKAIEEALANSRAQQRAGRQAYGRAWRGNPAPIMEDPTQSSMEVNVPEPMFQMQVAQQLRQPRPPVSPGPPRRGRSSRDFLLGLNY
jgi:hypothetical protein